MPTVLITGANRGVGAALLEAYLEKGYTVIAAVRTPSSVKEREGVVVVKLDQGSRTDAKEAVAELQKKGIKQLDIVIANAAINPTGAWFKDLDLDQMEELWKVNVRGPLVLFQATHELIPPKTGKFIVVSSGAGRIGRIQRKGGGSYGQTKASINFMVAQLHKEHDDLIVQAINPGWVPTDMGLEGAKRAGMDDTPNRLEQTIPGMLKVIDEATKEETSGKMYEWSGGEPLSW